MTPDSCLTLNQVDGYNCKSIVAKTINDLRALVAELVDALDLGSSATGVSVRV